MKNRRTFTTDDLALLAEGDLKALESHLLLERTRTSNPTPAEVDLCYVQRELETRARRAEIHSRFLEDERIALAEWRQFISEGWR